MSESDAKMRADLAAARAEIERLRGEQAEALRRAYDLTLETQSIGEAVEALAGIARIARARADADEQRVRVCHKLLERAFPLISPSDALSDEIGAELNCAHGRCPR